MSLEEREAYHAAGIGILAVKLDVRLLQLSIGFDNHWARGPILERLEYIRAEEVAHVESARMRVEDYVTVCLGGTAGELLYVLGKRRHLQRSIGDEILDWRFWRRTWNCDDPEVDRAFAIVFASLSKRDAADVECTMRRLWQRAVNLLRESPQRQQLDRLANRLCEKGKLSGTSVLEIVKGLQ